ncbi:hypothetical protein LWI29_019926 [Acer saccharum]|uniref:Uncharacterized protein n=1 Tax=Acer saccharum TaxID=4024 RepID=A0AA39VMV2_ACESA|nr:hypothetical protein LWI29_019926 [Acer saccharum]
MTLVKDLGEKVSKLTIRGNESNPMTTKSYFLMDKVVVQFNMASARMVNWVGSEIGGTDVVKVEQCGKRNGVAKFMKEKANTNSGAIGFASRGYGRCYGGGAAVGSGAAKAAPWGASARSNVAGASSSRGGLGNSASSIMLGGVVLAVVDGVLRWCSSNVAN